MGIALPTWVVDSQNQPIVLAMYGLVFGVGLPLLVARWWYGSRSRTKDGVLNATALSFFLNLKPKVTADELPLLLAQTEELSQQYAGRLTAADLPAYERLEKATLASYESVYHKPLDTATDETLPVPVRRALVLLTAYLHRIESESARIEEIKYEMGHYTEKLLTSLMAISTAYNRWHQTNAIRDMVAHFVQAVPLQGGRVAELMQLPHITLPLAQTLAKHATIAKHGLQGLWKVPEAERRKLLCGDGALTEEQYAACLRVLGEWPRIELVDAYFTVIGEEKVSAGSLMHLVLKLRLLPLKRDGSLLKAGRRLDAKDRGTDNVRPGTADDSLPDEAHAGRQPTGYAHAPFFCEERRPLWYIQMGDSKTDHLILAPTKFGDVGATQTRVVHKPIIAPTEPGLYTFQVEVASDSFVGSLASKPMKLWVSEAVAARPDEEDDISDPEEDTIAGQMALMRGERVKPANVEYDEAAADEEEEEEEEESETDDDGGNDSDSDSD